MKNSLMYSVDYVTEYAVCDFVRRVRKIAESVYSFVMSVRLFAWNNSASTGGFLQNLIFEYF